MRTWALFSIIRIYRNAHINISTLTHSRTHTISIEEKKIVRFTEAKNKTAQNKETVILASKNKNTEPITYTL